MANGKRGAAGSRTTHTAELTTGQLVLAVSTFLIVLLGVFLLGIIVGEYQYKLRETRVADVPAVPDEVADGQGEGVQPNSFPELTPASTPAAQPEAFRPKSEPAPESVVVPAPSARQQASTKPAPTAPPPSDEPATPAEPPTPSPTESSPEPPSKPSPVTAAETDAPPANADVAKAESPAPSPKPAPAAKPAPKPLPIEPIDAEPEPPSPEPEPAGAEAAAKAPQPGAYSVQVAALSQRENADALKKRLTAHTTYPVDIVASSSKKLHIVLVGRFATEAEASRVRDELRKEKEFSQAFVTKR